MVNYKAIADEVDAKGYPDASTAFEAMKLETVQGAYYPLKDNDLRIWAAQQEPSFTGMKSAAAGGSVAAQMAVLLVETYGSRLDLNKPEVVALLDGFVLSAVITEEAKDALYATALNMEPKWPGLQEGHVVNAIEQRQEGVV